MSDLDRADFESDAAYIEALERALNDVREMHMVDCTLAADAWAAMDDAHSALAKSGLPEELYRPISRCLRKGKEAAFSICGWTGLRAQAAAAMREEEGFADA